MLVWPSNKKGFSLIELMIVLVIIAVLMGFAIPEVTRSINEAKMETQKANVRTLQKKLDEYYRDHGHYPEDLMDLVNAPHPYFRELPKDPFTNRANWEVCDWKVTNVWLTVDKWRANAGYRKGSYIFDVRPHIGQTSGGDWER